MIVLAGLVLFGMLAARVVAMVAGVVWGVIRESQPLPDDSEA